MFSKHVSKGAHFQYFGVDAQVVQQLPLYSSGLRSTYKDAVGVTLEAAKSYAHNDSEFWV